MKAPHSPYRTIVLATFAAVAGVAPHPASAAPANTAAAVAKCVQTSKAYEGHEAKLRAAADLPPGRDAAKAVLGKLMAASRQFPRDVATPAMEAVCAGLISIHELQNYAKVRSQLSDPKALEANVSIPCPDCGGQPLDPETCPKCGGNGDCPNPKCQGGRQVTPSIAGTAPMVVTCMTCKGTTKCPTCKGEGTVGATCRRCLGKGLVLDVDNARDIFRQYMDEAIGAARAKQVVVVETTGHGSTAKKAIEQAIEQAIVQVHGRQKAAAALSQGVDAVVKAYVPVGAALEGMDGTFEASAKVCVAKVLPEAAPAPAGEDPVFGGLGDAW